jgi:uncharacterized protein (TIGR03032 family)
MTNTKKTPKVKQTSIPAEQVAVGATAQQSPAPEEQVKYSMSNGFAEFLAQNQLSVALTSYQSSKLYLLGKNPKGGLMVNEQVFPRAMGLSFIDRRLYISSMGHILKMENILAEDQWINETFTTCYVPRIAHFIGDLDCHDVGLNSNNELVFVNTKYNCLSTTSDVHSFKEYWRPSFISKLVPEDRCHLNGMAMENGEVMFVTAVCKSDTIDGWRDRRSGGGIVVDVKTNKIVCEGLSMPHSPRVHNGKLWILNSGTGELGWVDTNTNKFIPVAFCPGFLRGLSFQGDLAFVGLSRPRYQRFEGLPLDQRLKDADSEPWTGVQVIDTRTGACVHWFRMDGPVAELYDVVSMPGVVCAKSVGFGTPEAQSLITIATE